MALVIQSSFRLALIPLDVLSSIIRCFRLLMYFSYPAPGVNCFSSDFWFSYWKTVLETKIWSFVSIGSWVSNLTLKQCHCIKDLSVDRTRTYMCGLHSTHGLTSICACLPTYLWKPWVHLDGSNSNLILKLISFFVTSVSEFCKNFGSHYPK